MPRDANIARISQQPGCWRVDGIGEIHGFNGKYPKTNIYMSGLLEDQIAKPLHSSSLNGEHQVIKDIPLNWIRELKLGSVWEGGERIYLPGVMSGQYEIDTRDIKIVQYSQSVELEGVKFDYALPRKAIHFGENVSDLNENYLAIVPVLNQNGFRKYLAIPCVELFNFYICVSNRYCNSAITGSMDRYVEWKGNRLKILKVLSLEEKLVAYRSFYNKQGRSWFNYPRNSINFAARKNDTSQSATYRMPVTLKANFPFSGTTKLTIAGKPFPYELPDGEKVWAIFVSNIINCSYEDGFDPIIESDDGVRTNDPGFVNDEEGFYGEPEEDPFEDQLELEENGGQEDELVTTPSVVHLPENRFSVLGALKLTHIRSGEDENPVNPSNDHGENGLHRPVEEATDYEGSNSYGSHVPASRDLETFIAMVKQLRELTIEEEWEVVTRYGVEPIQIDGEVVNSFPLDMRKRSWKMIDAPEGGQLRRPRQIAWVEISIPSLGYVYLMELELKPNESGRSTLLVFRKDGLCMSNADFKLFLGLVAVRNGWPQKDHEWKTEKVRNIAASYFESYGHRSLHHVPGLSNHEEASGVQAKEWATSILKSFKNEVISLGSVKSIRSL